MPDVKRSIKIITEQKIIPGADSGVAGFPLRHWTMRVVLLHADTKQEIDADIFESVTYVLHESFGDKARQVLKKPPFRVSEDGWGEFELMIELKDLAGRLHNIVHDLNFSNARYETKQIITFKNPKGALLDALRNSGPIPGEAATNGADASSKKRTSEIGAGNTQKKKKGGDGKAIDMDKLAEGLQKLGEDDLLQVVQMVHDNKSEDSWMRNDVEQGEFHVDLYTLPENLIKMLWDFTTEKNAISASA
ncbi:transcription factor TFIIF complex subunit Tfg3 [Exophiala xenobiotica]|uniref:Transcription factor TFIIF complex subunit Tfg3 n=1 Tax=Vermiconidia calcicola TaxID=1690605 RepID=A0AAV9QCE3_9PEZI|nr:transcription factor TFIIF complex subunit Tfg3 [Exophiala xenobiotica]KAK5539942.1 transcription factor TFIIF complex subunit Tfg3 [Vermiconidia calcicola]KAK5546939.1 transcription factor TFIIF complex subunit Tfg3 [Chaetothyriales sp. CCFEE 6169]KAK5199865.1 transcription factor TFIIF complex subunit Tfg3 [Exophiala xenobiotica]KAK5211034.1 transcription factor TFIIF complex subunit Tfg3 [Exophiala xenobiotica]